MLDTQLDWVKHYKRVGNEFTGLNTRDDNGSLVIFALKTERQLIE